MVDPDRLKLYRYVTAPEADDYLAIMDRLHRRPVCRMVRPGRDRAGGRPAGGHRHAPAAGIWPTTATCSSALARYGSRPSPSTRASRPATPFLHSVPDCTARSTAFLAVTGGAREVPRELLALVAEGLARLDPRRGARVAGRRGLDHLRPVPRVCRVGHRLLHLYRIGPDPQRPRRRGVGRLQGPPARLPGEHRRERPAPRPGHIRLPGTPPARIAQTRSTGSPTAMEASPPCRPPAPVVRTSNGHGAARRADWDQLRPGSSDRAPASFEMRRTGRSEPCSPASSGSMPRRPRRSPCAATISSWRPWFDAATPLDAHALAAAAFGPYGARHLGVPLDDDIAEAVPATHELVALAARTRYRSPSGSAVIGRPRGSASATAGPQRPEAAPRWRQGRPRPSVGRAPVPSCWPSAAPRRGPALGRGHVGASWSCSPTPPRRARPLLPDHDVRLRVTASPGPCDTSEIGDLVVEVERWSSTRRMRRLAASPIDAGSCRGE